MILMTSESDLVRVVTSAATDIEVHASWIDNASGTITPGRTNTASITTATTTTVVGSPGASTQRAVKHLNIRNNHATDSCVVTVFHTDGTSQEDLFEVTLAAGEALVLAETGVWVYYDATGKPYVGVGPVATQAEMEAGTSTTTVVTPGRAHFHPSSAKFWVKTTPGSVNAASYNVTSVADTSAGITVITLATDFGTASWCCQCSVESTSDTMTVTNLKFARIGLGDQAAGSVNIECHDLTAITSVLEDPTAWHAAGYGDFA